MAGRGMGIATQGGGAVSSGARNKTQSTPSKSTGIPMLAKGGEINQHKRMAMGEKLMAKGGDAKKMNYGGMAGKMMKHGGDAKKMNYGGMAGKMMKHGGAAKKTKKMRIGGCA